MNFEPRHELRKINGQKDEYEIVIFLDSQMTEFADELGNESKESNDFITSIKDMIKNKYPNLKVNMIKVMIGGLAITSIPLIGANANAAQAAETTAPTTQMVQSSSIYYSVSSGDTLWGISQKFNTSVDNIKRANNLTTNILKINQNLIIPKAFHTVVSGDNLFSLAGKYGTTEDAIKQANGLSSNVIRIGQSLVMPNVIGGATPTTTQTEASTYTVVAGDSLWAIANRNNITVDALRSANNLTSDVLSIGQTLKIPSSTNTASPTNQEVPTTANIQYKVVSGDTLWSIAKSYNVSVDALRSSNNLDSDQLQIGQTLIIPKDSQAVSAPALTPASDTPSTYTVASGDTLYSVATKFNLSVDQLKQTNNLTSNTIQVGQVLNLSGNQTQTPSAPTSEADASIEAVQKNLQKLGYYAVTTMTGSYDSPTQEAIRDFQSDYGLSVTGMADTTTTTAIQHAVVKQDLINDTKNYYGVPYLWGGTTPSGFDCSGFVYYMFNKHGVDMTRNTSSGLYQMGTSISKADLQPGDLVFYSVNSSSITHVGFYMGDNQFVSATSSKGIAAYSLDNSYWSQYYVGAKRIY